MIETIRSLPDKPGIYQYFDASGRLLYVGKAKSLKKRVKNYWLFTPSFRPNPALGARISKMLREADHLEYLLTPTEEDALILENSLIKQLKPKYNILLRDDKTYPYIYINLSEDFPRFEITRKVVKGSGIKYWGPFPNGGRALLNALYEIYPLVQKRSGLHSGKACLFHQIGKCPAPCEQKISPQEYHRTLKQAIRSIERKSLLISRLQEKMSTLAMQERFEEAARLRDQIEAIEGLRIVSDIDMARKENIDVFAIQTDQKRGVVVRMFVRSGRIASVSHTFFRRTELFDPDEAYRQALLDHYSQDIPIPPQSILVAQMIEDDGLSEAISSRIGRKVSVSSPQKGAKKRLVDVALSNAQELLRQETRQETVIEEELRELLRLSSVPYRVEVFDNSHMMGTGAAGAMAVWDEGKWDKPGYRRYALNAQDEYAQMKEMLSKRIEDFSAQPPPDLWLLDGGETLRQLALKLLSMSGVNLEVVAIAKEKLDAKAHRAKGAARDILYADAGIFDLSPADKRLQWCQRLRDEAHRSAVAYHKKRKQKEDIKISLLQKKGIGPATVKKLLDYFGTFEAVDNADLDELTQVVGQKTANLLSKNRN